MIVMLGVFKVCKNCHHVMPIVFRFQNRSGCGLSKGLVLVGAAGSGDMASVTMHQVGRMFDRKRSNRDVF